MALKVSPRLQRPTWLQRTSTRATAATQAIDKMLSPNGQVYDSLVSRDEAVWALSHWLKRPRRARRTQLHAVVDAAATRAQPQQAASLVAVCLGAMCVVRHTRHHRRGERGVRLIAGALRASAGLGRYREEIELCLDALRHAKRFSWDPEIFFGMHDVSGAMHRRTCAPTPRAPAVLSFVCELSSAARSFKDCLPWRRRLPMHLPVPAGRPSANMLTPPWPGHHASHRQLKAARVAWTDALETDLSPFLLSRYHTYGPAPQGRYTDAAHKVSRVCIAALRDPESLRALVGIDGGKDAPPRYQRDLIALAYAGFLLGPMRLLCTPHGPHVRAKARRVNRVMHQALASLPAMSAAQAFLRATSATLDHAIAYHHSCRTTCEMLEVCAATFARRDGAQDCVAGESMESARLLFEMVAAPHPVLMPIAGAHQGYSLGLLS